jgi:VanZ family protein
LNEAIAMTGNDRSPARRGPARFVPPILWMGLIGLGSSSLLSGSRTGHWMYSLFGQLGSWATPALFEAVHLAIRKIGHLLEFGVLAVLWYRALAPAPRAAAAAFLLATAYGAVDELRQGLDPSRVPAVSDVVVDGLGAWIALAAWTESRALRAATLGVAAWVVGLLAGLGVLGTVLDVSLGRPAGDAAGAALGLGLLAVGLARWAQGARLAAAPPPGRPAGDAAGRP